MGTAGDYEIFWATLSVAYSSLVAPTGILVALLPADEAGFFIPSHFGDKPKVGVAK